MRDAIGACIAVLAGLGMIALLVCYIAYVIHDIKTRTIPRLRAALRSEDGR